MTVTFKSTGWYDCTLELIPGVKVHRVLTGASMLADSLEEAVASFADRYNKVYVVKEVKKRGT